MAKEAQNATRAAAKTMLSKGQEAASSAAETMTRSMQDFTRLFGQPQMPSMPGMETLMAAYRRNIETLTAANRVAMEGAQTVARRNMEIMQQTLAEMSETVQAVTAAETPHARAAKQAELLKSSYERLTANLKEISDLIARANGEAVGLVNQRVTAALDEMKQLIEHSRKPED